MSKIWKRLLVELIIFAGKMLGKYVIEGNDSVPKENTMPKVYEVLPDSTVSAQSVSIVKEQWLFLLDVAKLINYIETLPGHTVTGGELFRTPEQQAIYVAKGLSKTSNSKHLKRLAIDLNLFIHGKYQTEREPYKKLAAFWKSLSPKNVAGYDFGWDANHFERSI